MMEFWEYFFHNSMFYFKAKVNNASLVGIGYTQTLRPGTEGPSLTLVTTEDPFNHNLYLIKPCILSFMPGMKVTLSALVDGKNINAGGHKLGLGLELEAWGGEFGPTECSRNSSWIWPEY